MMKVLAKPGAKCPKENNPRDYITDSVPVEVPNSSYYLRLIADGSLVPAPEATQKTKKGE